jgi:hypothetical protein
VWLVRWVSVGSKVITAGRHRCLSAYFRVSRAVPSQWVFSLGFLMKRKVGSEGWEKRLTGLAKGWREDDVSWISFVATDWGIDAGCFGSG